MSPTEYLLRIEDIVKKRNVLDDYLARYKTGEISIEIIAAIAMKYEDRKEDDKAVQYYRDLIKKYPDSSSEYFTQAEYFLASYDFKSGDAKSLKNYIINNPGSPFIIDAFNEMIYYYANSKQLDNELAIYKEMLVLFPQNPRVLNSYAWRMAEIEMNLEDALTKARIAVELTKEDLDTQAGILDTEAEVLWKLKRYKEAIDTIERAIRIDPQNLYYQDQRNKFIQSTKEKSYSA